MDKSKQTGAQPFGGFKHVVDTRDPLISALAQIRDLFPIPGRGDPLEIAWMEAMAFPESVPAYVKQALAQTESANRVAFSAGMVEGEKSHDGQQCADVVVSTESAYTGANCPVCNSFNIESGSLEADGNIAWAPVHCSHCGSAWNDQYVLNSYTMVETKEIPA